MCCATLQRLDRRVRVARADSVSYQTGPFDRRHAIRGIQSERARPPFHQPHVPELADEPRHKCRRRTWRAHHLCANGVPAVQPPGTSYGRPAFQATPKFDSAALYVTHCAIRSLRNSMGNAISSDSARKFRRAVDSALSENRRDERVERVLHLLGQQPHQMICKEISYSIFVKLAQAGSIEGLRFALSLARCDELCALRALARPTCRALRERAQKPVLSLPAAVRTFARAH